MKKENFESNIEMQLRSEKVRIILGAIPYRLVYWGTFIIVSIILGLLFALFFVPCPYSEGQTIYQYFLNI